MKMFQFHNGSIKSTTIEDGGKTLLKFQFHNGSIKSKTCSYHRTHAKAVSIPQWFD